MVDTLLEWLRLPGETAAAWLVARAPDAAALVGVTDGQGRETLAIVLAVVCWLGAALLAGFVVEKIRDFDRKATSYLSGRHAEAKRQLRILRRRLASALGALREGRQPAPGIAVTEIELPQLEARVLRCFGSEGALRGMAADEVAGRLKLSLQQVEAVLRQLYNERLVERAFGTDQGRETHRITQAGQIYLLER